MVVGCMSVCVWVCVSIYIYISVYLGGDEAKKVTKIQWLGEREKEGKGELKWHSLALCSSTPFSITARLVCQFFFLFLSISRLFIFLQSSAHSAQTPVHSGPPPPHPPPRPVNPTPSAAPYLCSFCRCPTADTRKQIPPWLSATCFASLSLAPLHRLKT